MNDIDFVDARPINGYLTHAVRYQPEHFYHATPVMVMTQARALCGVGRAGMRVRTNEDGEIQPYKGIDGCDTCFIRVRDIRKANA
jgi:hypothetical protein